MAAYRQMADTMTEMPVAPYKRHALIVRSVQGRAKSRSFKASIENPVELLEEHTSILRRKLALVQLRTHDVRKPA